MRAAGILLAAGLFMAAQASAWSEREQNVLLGIGAGIVLAEIHNDRRIGATCTYARPREVIYVYPYYERGHGRKHCMHPGRGERGRFGR